MKASKTGQQLACKGFSGLTKTEMPGVGASFICLNFSHKHERNEIVHHEHKPFRVPWAIVWEPLRTFFLVTWDYVLPLAVLRLIFERLVRKLEEVVHE